MKRLVVLGEGHGEVPALPILLQRILKEKNDRGSLYLDKDVIRTRSSRLARWDKGKQQPDYSSWVARVELAASRREIGAVLAVYDGDFSEFPVGSSLPFCAATAAKGLAAAARQAGAGNFFSLGVVFASPEYETWLVAGAKSFAGRRLGDGRMLLPPTKNIPDKDFESRGKGWLERNCSSYRPMRDQAALTEILDLELVRSRNVRSFTRLEHALDQLMEAVRSERHISTPV
jgi:hypothetical protein